MHFCYDADDGTSHLVSLSFGALSLVKCLKVNNIELCHAQI
jgi:hypothetical protein